MNSDRNIVVNEAAMNLLIKACPVELGMPAKLIREFVYGKYAAISVDDVCSLSQDSYGNSMLEQFLDKRGYAFSWGLLSEESMPSDPDNDKSLPVLRYEFLPVDLLVLFPDAGQLEDLFMDLYRNHPYYDPDFDCDEGFGNWSVIAFQSKEGHEEELRQWVAEVFIPLIWHDLLCEATRIVEEKIAAAIAQSPAGSFKELFVERGRCQLCVDPAELQFEALKLEETI